MQATQVLKLSIAYAQTKDKSDSEKEHQRNPHSKCPHRSTGFQRLQRQRQSLDQTQDTSSTKIEMITQEASRLLVNGHHEINTNNISAAKDKNGQEGTKIKITGLSLILFNGKWIKFVENTRACNTVECGSDHRIVTTKIKIKLRMEQQS